MRSLNACSSQGNLSRRHFLAGATGGALGTLGFGGMVRAESARKLASQQKHTVVFWLAGGASQLETWDPKPGTETGGPFQAIPTSVPGIRISELMPYTARQMHHLALVRGINTKVNNHAKGAVFMQTGHRQRTGFEYPYLGSVFSSLLSPPDNPLPGYICVGGGGTSREAAFLGPQHAPLTLNDGQAPHNLKRTSGLTPEADARRRALRRRMNRRFTLGRRQAQTEIYNASYDQAAALMARKDIFDFSRIPDKDVQRYGKHPFGRHCLMARQLVESGITFVKVAHSQYDTHSENFNFHLEQLGEFDRPFATFVSDLAERGLLEHTLIIVMCEFGRTPRINQRLGRDHWGTAWSVAVGGCGIKRGVVVGKTNANGTRVVDREVNAGHLFHTYYEAVGLDSTEPFYHNGRPFTKAAPNTSAIKELLS